VCVCVVMASLTCGALISQCTMGVQFHQPDSCLHESTMNTLVPYLLFGKVRDLDSLLLGLEKRLPQLEAEVSELEREDDGDLYGVVTLQVIYNEFAEIQQLLDQLNSSHLVLQRQNSVVSEKVQPRCSTVAIGSIRCLTLNSGL